MRYLVVIPPHTGSQTPTHRELDTTRELVEGDHVILNEHLMRIDTIIDGPRERGFDATLICIAGEV